MTIIIEFDPAGPRRVERAKPGITLREALAGEPGLEGLCNGRGMCGRCRCHVDERDGLVAPMTERERRTLDLLPDSRADHRLACQTRVLAGRVHVALERDPGNLRIEDLTPYVGRRARVDLEHPETGERLVRAGQVMLRMQLLKLAGTTAGDRLQAAAGGA